MGSEKPFRIVTSHRRTMAPVGIPSSDGSTRYARSMDADGAVAKSCWSPPASLSAFTSAMARPPCTSAAAHAPVRSVASRA